ncbi:MAG: asparagine synthase (glutamine-hydrolyzing) [Flavobacteriales bacterium]|nr:asparagine synthase (glutamine-hydrolyzing) [Flavobacteriales bacterium]|tara:strand:- start:468 stop:2351 length:1884 start_codon:yes stop_codon:yes gene_type:complete
MCGIVGIFAKDETGKLNFSKLNNSVESLHYRGPDSKGIYIDKNIGLGHTRLSIIDTSNAANQPFTSPDKRYTLVFNGEIYNYKSLKKVLENRGYSFKTSSDTEVLLYHLIEFGEAGINDLNGFFGFAFYDKETQETIVARDRFGIKPLHLYEDEHQLIFASEMKAIFEFNITKKINLSSLQLYFKFNYIPQPLSILENCKKLQPGEILKWKDGKSKTKKYYTLAYTPGRYLFTDYNKAQRKLRELLEESVSNRLVSDVPIGAFLSGGIDSSVITALASKHTQNLNTFSIGYKDEPLFDETKYARLVAEKYKTNHTVFELKNDDLYHQLHQVLEYTDEPFADSSGLAVNILSMYTRKKSTVALSGDGADEIFSGYNKHMAEFLVRENSFKSKLVSAGRPLWKVLPKSRNSKIGNLNRQLLRYADGLKKGNSERYWDWAGILKDQQAADFIKKVNPIQFKEDKKNILSPSLSGSDFNGVLFQDVNQVLVSDMLTKVDLNSMNNSLEVRVPFLDHNVVEFAFQIPEEFKIQKGIKKKILQETFKNDLPEELFKRPKHGFEVPLLKWFRGDFENEIKSNYLNKDFIIEQNLFNWQNISDLIKKLHSKNPEDSAASIWAFIVFQHWWKKWYC